MSNASNSQTRAANECAWVEAGPYTDYNEGDIVEKQLGDEVLVLMRSAEKIYAAQAICPHMEERLCNGLMKRTTLICTRHLWQWSLESGEPMGLAEKPLQVYPTRVDQGVVYVNIKP